LPYAGEELRISLDLNLNLKWPLNNCHFNKWHLLNWPDCITGSRFQVLSSLCIFEGLRSKILKTSQIFFYFIIQRKSALSVILVILKVCTRVKDRIFLILQRHSVLKNNVKYCKKLLCMKKHWFFLELSNSVSTPSKKNSILSKNYENFREAFKAKKAFEKFQVFHLKNCPLTAYEAKNRVKIVDEIFFTVRNKSIWEIKFISFSLKHFIPFLCLEDTLNFIALFILILQPFFFFSEVNVCVALLIKSRTRKKIYWKICQH